MVDNFRVGLWAGLLSVLMLLCGCATKHVDMQQVEVLEQNEEQKAAPPAPAAAEPRKSTKAASAGKDARWKNSPLVRRAITEKELRRLEAKDPGLDFSRCVQILSRLNKKDKEYVRNDMKRKRPMLVPRDFSAYKDWTPLPPTIASIGKFPKLILVVKNISFIGWYEHGKLVDDSYVCVGKMNTWTKRGTYRIKQKDPEHMSTYPNAYGDPAYMPMALHVYERVWIHAGDVTGPNCSHGCINVPLYQAEKLYSWTDIGTVVIISESMKDLGQQVKAVYGEKPPNNVPARSEQKNAAPKANTQADKAGSQQKVTREF